MDEIYQTSGVIYFENDLRPIGFSTVIPCFRFTPIARSSYAWERIYKSRTAAERVNSRIDNVYGFERHFIRGLSKMKLKCSLTLLVMLALAIGRIKQKQPELMRSLKTG